MSWWNARYKNDYDEYEIHFGSKYLEKTKIVEKVCCAIIDKVITTQDDVSFVKHGWWIRGKVQNGTLKHKCSVCKDECEVPTCVGKPIYTYCPNCGAKMDLEEK